MKKKIEDLVGRKNLHAQDVARRIARLLSVSSDKDNIFIKELIRELDDVDNEAPIDDVEDLLTFLYEFWENKVINEYYKKICAKILGWDIWLWKKTTREKRKYYCSKEKEFIMWLDEFLPLTNSNHLNMVIEEMNKQGYSLMIEHKMDIKRCYVHEELGHGSVPRSFNENEILSKAVIDACAEAKKIT